MLQPTPNKQKWEEVSPSASALSIKKPQQSRCPSILNLAKINKLGTLQFLLKRLRRQSGKSANGQCTENEVIFIGFRENVVTDGKSQQHESSRESQLDKGSFQMQKK